MDLNIFIFITLTLISIVMFMEVSRFLGVIIDILESINVSLKSIEHKLEL